MSDQDEVIAFLAAADGGRTQRIDTHASSVFLTRDRAYKLKRAVRYSYLDYSTLDRREAACRAELAINHHMAPALYLGVRAIRRRSDGMVGFDGDGETLDWVVEMRRFDDDGLFDRMAEEGRLTPALMRQVADAIVAFHARAEPVAQYGGSAAIAAVIDGNRENLRRFPAILDPAAVEALDRASRETLAVQAALLDRRRADGKVRACHGDLHLGNICLLDGQPTLFDAVEFSPAFSRIDVLYDLAFLLMDLLHRGLAGFANAVLNRYLDRSQEDQGLAALPLFLSLRAAIRAHVAATAAARQATPAQRRAREEEAPRYLDLARAFLAPAPPRLVAIGGRSGSGKSTLALEVAANLPPMPGARILRSDVMRKVMAGLAPEAPLPATAYTATTGQQVYARMRETAASVLAAGYSVILDATFLDPHERVLAADVAARAGVPFAGLWLEAKPEIMAARLAARRGDASDATIAVLERQLAQDPGPLTWRRIDSGAAPADIAAALRGALAASSEQG